MFSIPSKRLTVKKEYSSFSPCTIRPPLEALFFGGRGRAGRQPMLLFTLERALLTCKAPSPALAPLFQLPPRIGYCHLSAISLYAERADFLHILSTLPAFFLLRSLEYKIYYIVSSVRILIPYRPQ